MARVEKVREYVSETSPVYCDKKKYLKKITDKLVISGRKILYAKIIHNNCLHLGLETRLPRVRVTSQ